MEKPQVTEASYMLRINKSYVLFLNLTEGSSLSTKVINWYQEI